MPVIQKYREKKVYTYSSYADCIKIPVIYGYSLQVWLQLITNLFCFVYKMTVVVLKHAILVYISSINTLIAKVMLSRVYSGYIHITVCNGVDC